MSDNPNHENKLLWTSLEQNTEEINRLVDELSRAESQIRVLRDLVRNLTELIRRAGPDDLAILKTLAAEVRESLQEIERHDVN